MHGEYVYLNLVEKILVHGSSRTKERTGVGTRSLFGEQISFDLAPSLRGGGFPLLTTKKMYWKGIVAELLWFISGSTDVKVLQDQGVHFWDDNAKSNGGKLGPIYGYQWNKNDQLAKAIELIKTNPQSRRIIVNAWPNSKEEMQAMALPPCHVLFQFYVDDGKLSCHMYQRSGDVGLGVPFNIASYALLVHLVAHVTDLSVGNLIISFGDSHIYENHTEQLFEQLRRTPKEFPTVKLNSMIKDIKDFTTKDIVLENYESHEAIKMKMAV